MVVLIGCGPAAAPATRALVAPTIATSPTPAATPTLVPTAAPTPTAAPSPTATTYRVKAGDTDTGIAEAFGIRIAALLAANLHSLVPGNAGACETQTSGTRSCLDLVTGRPLVIPPPGPVLYEFPAGGSPIQVCRMFGITTAQLIAANPTVRLANDQSASLEPLRRGTQLVIPTP
jgi:hypothetical protein